MYTVKMTAEISERNVGVNSRVIRIHLPNGHYYTRTCKLDSFGRIISHRSNFKPAKEKGLPLNETICEEIKKFANRFGMDGENFNTFAPRERRMFITESRRRSPNKRHRANESSDTGAFLAGAAVFAIASAILNSSSK